MGFGRQQKEYGGQGAMAKYIEGVETEVEATRAEVMDEILAYNREDLAATGRCSSGSGRRKRRRS